MDPQTKKEILVGATVTIVAIIGLLWIIGQLTDSGITSLSIIITFLILLLVFKNQLLPKKYRQAITKLDKKDNESS